MKQNSEILHFGWHPDEGIESPSEMQEIDETLNTGQGSI
jgi:hypothetical protein